MRFREADRMLKDAASRKVLLNPYSSRRGCNKLLPLVNNIDYKERSNDL